MGRGRTSVDPSLLWRDLVLRGPTPVLLFDRTGRCVVASRAAVRLVGEAESAIVGRLVDEILAEPDGSSAAGRLDRAYSAGTDFNASLRTASGVIPVRATATRHTTDGWVSVVLARDVDQNQAARARQRLELEHLIENTQTRFINTEPQRIGETVSWALEEIGRFLGADRSYVLAFDHDAETETMIHEWVGEGCEPELNTYVDVPWSAAPAASQRNTSLGISAVRDVSTLGGEWAADREFFESAGIRSILELPLVIDGHPVGALGFDWLTTLAEWSEDDLTLLGILASSFAQLLGREAAEKALRHREDHDALTGLLNRHGLIRKLDDLLLGTPDALAATVVVNIDVDGFKVVNDSFGPAFGDRLLMALADRLRGLVRSGDSIARIGGDEFCAVLLLDPGADPPASVVERLRLALSDPYLVDERGYRLTVSCGVATAAGSDDHEGAGVELLRRASAAVLRAKELGRSRQEEFDAELEDKVARRVELDQLLRGALERGEFEVYYQPEVDLASGRIVGAEALLRWRHDGRLVPAAEFIDLVESTGLILEVGPWVMDQACTRAREWTMEFGLERFVMRVNLSVRQLDQPDVVEKVRSALERHGLAPGRICLEVTETVLMADPERARRALDALDSLGVELAIDDFGTGYSSLAYLKRFPFDILKVDRSFVMGLPHDAEDLAIVRTVVALASALGMEVTAEGIEEQGQVAALLALGCRRGQGYLFARPMPADELAGLLGEMANIAQSTASTTT